MPISKVREFLAGSGMFSENSLMNENYSSAVGPIRVSSQPERANGVTSQNILMSNSQEPVKGMPSFIDSNILADHQNNVMKLGVTSEPISPLSVLPKQIDSNEVISPECGISVQTP